LPEVVFFWGTGFRLIGGGIDRSAQQRGGLLVRWYRKHGCGRPQSFLTDGHPTDRRMTSALRVHQ